MIYLKDFYNQDKCYELNVEKIEVTLNEKNEVCSDAKGFCSFESCTIFQKKKPSLVGYYMVNDVYRILIDNNIIDSREKDLKIKKINFLFFTTYIIQTNIIYYKCKLSLNSKYDDMSTNIHEALYNLYKNNWK